MGISCEIDFAIAINILENGSSRPTLLTQSQLFIVDSNVQYTIYYNRNNALENTNLRLEHRYSKPLLKAYAQFAIAHKKLDKLLAKQSLFIRFINENILFSLRAPLSPAELTAYVRFCSCAAYDLYVLRTLLLPFSLQFTYAMYVFAPVQLNIYIITYAFVAGEKRRRVITLAKLFLLFHSLH